ncbi:unnamed protein product [Pelagomonas calceolata]|uniref:ATP-dependent DNA helicase n=1 Tax=Pelagomonas calceolata TaxID=35677 RepID=A0A8J2SYU4_9STRA|nr:unnamed protein product [Pelagomonas calceolata]
MELTDDPIENSQDQLDAVPQQQEGEDIDNSDDEAPAAPASAPPVAPPPPPPAPPVPPPVSRSAPPPPQPRPQKRARHSSSGSAFETGNLLFANTAQRSVLRLVLEDKKNVFYTGSAGTGKSFTTRLIIEAFRKQYGDKFNRRVAVVAPTGIAAANVDGTTIHRAAGVGVPGQLRDFGRIWEKRVDVPGLSPDEKAPLLWRELEHLIIDELSMLSGEFLDRLAAEVRKMRGDSRPFGGIQLIACGDLLQLPPIENSYEPDQGVEFDADNPADVTNQLGPLFCARGRCFEARCFWDARFHYVKLTECYRQADRVFSGILDRIRVGDASDREELNENCLRPAGPGLTLFPRNREADALNDRKFRALEGTAETWAATDAVCLFQEADKISRANAVDIVSDCFKDFLAIDEVQLKVGCRVLMLANVDPKASLFNGAQGEVVRWATPDELFARAISDAETLAEDCEVWRTSHVKRRDRCAAAWLVDRLVEGARVPVCRFEGQSEVIVTATLFEREVAGIGVARRRQMPLRLAWALSVHKSQGMGLKQVRFDPAKTFDDGQVYVALSRATTMEGLSLVSRVLPRHLRCDSRALRMIRYLDSLLADGAADVQLPANPPEDLVRTWEQRPPKIRRRSSMARAIGSSLF